MSDDIKIEILNIKEVEQQLKKVVLNNPNFKPKLITVDDPNGVYVEFGTRPSRYRSHSRESKAYRNILHWVENKPGLSPRLPDDDFAYAVFKNIMTNGMRPQPFVRPAIHKIQEELKSGSGRFKGKDLQFVAEALRDEMIATLRMNQTPFERPIDEHIEIKTIEGPNDIPSDILNIPQNVWDDETLNIEGKTFKKRVI